MTRHEGLEAVLPYFPQANGRLLAGGRPVSEIVAHTGTPAYIYDLGVARKKYEKLRAVLPDEVDIHYAVKANPHPHIVSFFAQTCQGLDVASVGEMQLALEAGADPARMGFAGPGKRREEIRRACHAGIGSLNAESIEELELADQIAREEGRTINVSLRINPAYELSGSGMKMGGGPKQFGIDQEEIPHILERFQGWNNLSFVGFHIFSGSQNLRAESIVASFEKVLDTVIELLPSCPKMPATVNLGGGFGIPYFAGDSELDIEAVGAGLQKAIKERQGELPGTSFIAETGRYLVGECALFVCTVLYRKASRGEVFLVVDGGMHQHLAASGNFGQVIKRNYPIADPERIHEQPLEEANIVGPLCTPLDKIGSKVALPGSYPGDRIAVFCSGAYGFSASPRGFLSHPEPEEIVIEP